MYGAGGDSNTKSSFATGWNAVNGHWPVGTTGGEEQHILSIGEMPSHNHSPVYLGGSINDAGDPGDLSITTPTNMWGAPAIAGSYTGYTGGNQAHNILPRFMVLAYIMKL